MARWVLVWLVVAEQTSMRVPQVVEVAESNVQSDSFGLSTHTSCSMSWRDRLFHCGPAVAYSQCERKYDIALFQGALRQRAQL